MFTFETEIKKLFQIDFNSDSKEEPDILITILITIITITVYFDNFLQIYLRTSLELFKIYFDLLERNTSKTCF